jgi:hypothetical protein
MVASATAARFLRLTPHRPVLTWRNELMTEFQGLRTSRAISDRALIVFRYARGPGVPQNFDRHLDAFVLGFEQHELTAMRKGCGVCFNHSVGQVIIGQMGFESPNNRLMVWLAIHG